MAALSPFEKAFISRSQSRLLDSINQLFGASGRDLPREEEILGIAKSFSRYVNCDTHLSPSHSPCHSPPLLILPPLPSSSPLLSSPPHPPSPPLLFPPPLIPSHPLLIPLPLPAPCSLPPLPLLSFPPPPSPRFLPSELSSAGSSGPLANILAKNIDKAIRLYNMKCSELMVNTRDSLQVSSGPNHAQLRNINIVNNLHTFHTILTQVAVCIM